jgi:hypothetical protein
MAGYFSYMQAIRYSLNNDGSEIQQVKNIFSRTKMLNSIMDNINTYYDYAVKEGDTPEMVAYKFYGDANKHWLVLFSNFMVDPYFDWPLNSKSFDNYIIRKYGSIRNAQTTIHHSEIGNLYTNTILGKRQTRFLTTQVSQYYYDFSDNQVKERTIPEINSDYELSSESLTAPDGTDLTIRQQIYSISNYDYENYLNEAKRNIKLVDSSYSTQIEFELQRLMAQQ